MANLMILKLKMYVIRKFLPFRHCIDTFDSTRLGSKLPGNKNESTLDYSSAQKLKRIFLSGKWFSDGRFFICLREDYFPCPVQVSCIFSRSIKSWKNDRLCEVIADDSRWRQIFFKRGNENLDQLLTQNIYYGLINLSSSENYCPLKLVLFLASKLATP